MQLHKKLLIAALACTAPFLAHAESTFVTGTTGSTTAHVDFTIVIPRILFLQVGTGTSLANNTAVNLITFTVPAANVGDTSVISGTGGDLSGGVVTAKVIGNNGNVTLTSSTAGALNDGAGDTVSWSQITTTAATNTSATALAAPALADTGTPSVTLTATNKVVNQDAKWTYKYLNANVVANGTYGGVNTNNGRVTYTASMP